MDSLKPSSWINSLNPNSTSLLFDMWGFAVPLAYKPTYLNMSFDFDSLNFSDLVLDGNWNLYNLYRLFGDNLLCFIPSFGTIDPNGHSHLV